MEHQIKPPGEARDQAITTRLVLIAVVFASGMAGLGYELVWTRVLSLALGTEMMAVLGVVAGFFGGLAIGAFGLDRLLRNEHSPALAYAALEAAIGFWGVISVWLLPGAARVSPILLGADPSPIMLWSVSFALPALLLLPATACMGGTLTALERLTCAVSGNEHSSAGVYGANTAGAVLGALLSVFMLMPQLGLSKTLLVFAAINALCAIGALQLHRPAQIPTLAKGGAGKLPTRLIATLFVTGLLGIAFETLIVRLATQVLQDTVYSFACLLAAYLLGAAMGGLLWQKFGKERESSNRSWLVAATALSCLLTAVTAPFITQIAEVAAGYGVVGEFAVAIALFLLPSIAMGALFGRLAQEVRTIRASLGWAVGVNSMGAAIAPLLTAQLFIPLFGVWRALVLVALSYLFLLPPRRSSLVAFALPAAGGLFLLAGPAPSFVRAPTGGTVLATREGPMATASVVDDAAGVRYLEVNGHFRMGGTSSARSDYRQAMLPLLLHPAPRRALFLGVGTGATLAGGAMMPGVDAKGVELSPEVVELLPWFVNKSASAPAPKVTVADARRYVSADRATYDVIVADLFHPALDGSGALYTIEHFAAVRERLSPGGLFCQWLPLYQLDLPSLLAVIRSFLEIYPQGSAWLNHYSVRTPMLALIGRRDGGSVDVDWLAQRLNDPAVAAVARPPGFRAPIDLLGQYVGGREALAAFAGEGPRNTDDMPFVTFDARANVRALTAPPFAALLAVMKGVSTNPVELLSVEKRDALDHAAIGRNRPIAENAIDSESVERALREKPVPIFSQRALGERLVAYWRARNRFLELGAALPGDPRGRALVDAAAPGLLETLRLSQEFEAAYAPLIGMAQSLITSDRRGAERLLRAIDAAAPQRRDARDILAQETGGLDKPASP